MTFTNSDLKNVHLCFIVDHVLQHYRIPLFRYLAGQGCRITICYPSWFKHQSPTLEELAPDLSKFVDTIPLNARKGLYFYYFGVKKLNQYDVVIFMQDLRVIDFWKATLNPFKSYKLIHWGIGVSSFEKTHWLTTILRNISSQFADKLILYSNEAKRYYLKSLRSKIEVAHNTIENYKSKDFSCVDKDIFLFIGRLDRRKGLTELINAFFKYISTAGTSDIQKLVIIGDGIMKEELKELVAKLNIQNFVMFVGAIKDDDRKSKYFERAQLCISLKQAGLAVLESFSYGVPFVTLKNSKTGGERFNIRHNKTGFLLESEAELVDLLRYSQKNRSKIKNIGTNAYWFYQEERSMKCMAETFVKTIKLVLKGFSKTGTW